MQEQRIYHGARLSARSSLRSLKTVGEIVCIPLLLLPALRGKIGGLPILKGISSFQKVLKSVNLQGAKG